MAYDPTNIFARILRGEIPCDKVFEDDRVLAFRDLYPKAPIHILIVPKGAYVDQAAFGADATDAEIVAFYRAVAKIARDEGLAATGFRTIANAGADGGQEVPHFHVHLLGGEKLPVMLA